MTASFQKVKNENRSIVFFAAIAFLVVCLLFFIDEGNYNFSWMTDAFAWFIFIIYAVPLFACQLLIYIVLPRNIDMIKKLAFASILGIAVGIFVVVGVTEMFS